MSIIYGGNDGIYDFNITNTVIVGKNKININGTFKVGYTEELGVFSIYNIIIDPATIGKEYAEGSRNCRAFIDLNMSDTIMDITVPPEKPVKMTVKEIEEKLGTKIEIISEKE